MSKILITDNPQAQTCENAFKPRKIVARGDISDKGVKFHDGTESALPDITDIILDGNDTNILLKFPNALRLYIPESLDFSADIDTIGKTLLAAELFAGPGKTPFNIKDDLLMGDDLSNCVAHHKSNDDDDEPAEIPIMDQIALLSPLIEGKRICEGSIAELTNNLVALCRDNELFVRDVITGLFRSKFFRKDLVPAAQAEMVFTTHFIDKLFIKTMTYRVDKNTGEDTRNKTYKLIKPNELHLLWQNIAYYSTFNSRREFYDSIPKWDGEPRINTFMKKYYNCDANPHFFLLFITSIIGMFDNPDKTYCPYFFDFVSRSRGIGKSLLCYKLLGDKYVGDIKMNKSRGLSDFFVDAYDGNNVVVMDDECNWCGDNYNQITYDEFKNMVTSRVDKFSRKHRDPEEHTRSFIIVRTSNDVNQVFAAGERRQIIFKCNLQPNECRIWTLPDEFWRQMLAEAKDFYEKYGGRYELSAEDEKEINKANQDNFNYESPDVFAIMGYIKAVRDNPEIYGVRPDNKQFTGKICGSYERYCSYCKGNKEKILVSRVFWRKTEAICLLPETGAEIETDKKFPIVGGGYARVFTVHKKPLTVEEEQTQEIEDIPY